MMMIDKLILSTLHMTYVVPIVKLTQRLADTIYTSTDDQSDTVHVASARQYARLYMPYLVLYYSDRYLIYSVYLIIYALYSILCM